MIAYGLAHNIAAWLCLVFLVFAFVIAIAEATGKLARFAGRVSDNKGDNYQTLVQQMFADNVNVNPWGEGYAAFNEYRQHRGRG